MVVPAASVRLVTMSVVSTLSSFDKIDPKYLSGIVYSRLLNGRLLFHSFCCSTVAGGVATYDPIILGLPYDKIVITIVECDT